MRAIALALVCLHQAAAQQYLVSTVAGGAPIQTPISALNASIDPGAITADSKGNVYFVSGLWNAVYKLDASGIITRFAGTGTPIPSNDPPDGALAASGQVGVFGIAVDHAGNLYLTDNYRIRKVTLDGIITTVAGSGSSIYSGDGGPALKAGFTLPTALEFDAAGNLYVADRFRIRKIATDGTITTVAGNGVGGYTGDGGPATSASLTQGLLQSITVDPAGNVYFAASNEARVRKVSVNGIISTVAGNGSFGTGGNGGPATQAQLEQPNGLAVDSSGNLLIADELLIRSVSPSGIISTFAGAAHEFSGGGPASVVNSSGIASLHFDGSGNLYLGESSSARIFKISANGLITSVAGNGFLSFSGDGGPARNAQLYLPHDVALDSSGALYIADTLNCEVRKMTPDGILRAFAGTGACGNAIDGHPAVSSSLGWIYGLAIGPDNSVYISDAINYCVWKVTPDGLIHHFAGGAIRGHGGDGGPATSAALAAPWGIAIDSHGNVYIADEAEQQIRKVDTQGIITVVAGNRTAGFSGDGGPAISAALYNPQSVAVDSAGNLYIADNQNGRIRRVTVDGTISTYAGIGNSGPIPSTSGDGGPATAAYLGNTQGLIFDQAGNLLCSSFSGIRKITPDGIITTIASSYLPYTGYVEDAPATSVGISGAQGLAADSLGNIYFADSSYSTVRILQPYSGLQVLNGANNIAGYAAPGEIVVLYGANLGPAKLVTSTPDSSGLYPTQLAGTKVLFGGIPAPLLYTSANQVAAIVPYSIASFGYIEAQVEYQGNLAAAQLIATSVAPGIFTLDSSGNGQAAAVNQDASINGPSSPAHTGDIVSFYVTGEGVTTPAGVDGKLNSLPLPKPVGVVAAYVGNLPATVQYAGGAYGEVAGLMQVNVQIPVAVTPGNSVPVRITVNGTFSQTVTIVVR